MVIVKQSEQTVTVTIQLSNGEDAGEGYGATQESAMYWAIQDCFKSEDTRYQTIGNFYKRMHYPA